MEEIMQIKETKELEKAVALEIKAVDGNIEELFNGSTKLLPESNPTDNSTSDQKTSPKV